MRGLLVGVWEVNGVCRRKGRKGRGGDVQFTIGRRLIWGMVFQYDGCIFAKCGSH